MKILDPGHEYILAELDVTRDDGFYPVLTFVKREGPGYPGNVGSHPGTTIQEVLKVCIDRLDYVDNQIPSDSNRHTKTALQIAIWHLEKRAAERHGRAIQAGFLDIEKLPSCPKCGHIECPGHET